jgi:hypothetical protein
MSPIESAIHDKSILDVGISGDDCAAANVVMMMMSVRRNVSGSSRNRQSAEDGCDGSGDLELIHDRTPPLKNLSHILQLIDTTCWSAREFILR